MGSSNRIGTVQTSTSHEESYVDKDFKGRAEKWPITRRRSMKLTEGQKTVLMALVRSRYEVVCVHWRVAGALQDKKLVKMFGLLFNRCRYIALTAKGRVEGKKLIA